MEISGSRLMCHYLLSSRCYFTGFSDIIGLVLSLSTASRILVPFFTGFMSSIATLSFFSSQNATMACRSGWSSHPSHVTQSGRLTSARQEPLRDGVIHNRENLVVSNREIRQLFDSMKEMGEIMRWQNAKLESMAAKLEDNSKEVNELKKQLKTALKRGSQTAEREYVHCGPVLKEPKVCANFNFHWVALCMRIHLCVSVFSSC